MPMTERKSELPEGMRERRGARRYPSMTRAMIVFGEPKVEIECVIRNISEAGALLVTPQAERVPVEFTLLSLYHPHMPCRVAWKREWRIGVQFADTPIRPIGG